MTRITDIRLDLQAESSVWLFKWPLAGGGGILWRPHYRPHSLLRPSLHRRMSYHLCGAKLQVQWLLKLLNAFIGRHKLHGININAGDKFSINLRTFYGDLSGTRWSRPDSLNGRPLCMKSQHDLECHFQPQTFWQSVIAPPLRRTAARARGVFTCTKLRSPTSKLHKALECLLQQTFDVTWCHVTMQTLTQPAGFWQTTRIIGIV